MAIQLGQHYSFSKCSTQDHGCDLAIAAVKYLFDLGYLTNLLMDHTINIEVFRAYVDAIYEFYVFRNELMFGDCAFPDASCAVEITASDINDTIVIPSDRSIFTMQGKFNFCELPRECVCNFTLYGTQKNNDCKDTIAEKDEKGNRKSRNNNKNNNKTKNQTKNMKDIVDDIESYHTSKYYKSGDVKNDIFFNETKEDDSVGHSGTVCEFNAFQRSLQSQATSIASLIGSQPVNITNINDINGNTNTTNIFSGVTGLDMQRMIDEIALQRTTSNTLGNNYNYDSIGSK